MATEKRLIYADDVKTIIEERYDTAFIQSRTRPNIAWWEGYSAGVNWVRNTINDAPTVDAVPVVHGRWVCLEPEIGYFACSECDHRILRAECNHCPNCGARMDLKEESDA